MFLKKVLTKLLVIFAQLFIRQGGWDRDLKKVVELYGGDEFMRVFSKIRIWDAPFSEIERIVPKSGLIVDLGCGDGILTNYLALKDTRRKLIGVELNKDRVREADKGIKNVSFAQGDILKKSFPEADAVLLIDVLHHLPSRLDQENMIKKIKGKLKKNGKLIIAEVGEKPFYKYVISWVTDAVIVPILFEKRLCSLNFYYRMIGGWRALLKKEGFVVKVKMVHKGKPFSHFILECTLTPDK